MDETTSSPIDFVEAGILLRKLLDTDPDEIFRAAKALGISLRKAYYLTEINKAFDGLYVPRQRLLAIGWSKLRLLAPYIDKNNRDKLIAQAEAHPVHELQEILKGNWSETAKHCVLLFLTEKEYAIFGKVIRQHGAIRTVRGYQKKEAALTEALKKTSGESMALTITKCRLLSQTLGRPSCARPLWRCPMGDGVSHRLNPLGFPNRASLPRGRHSHLSDSGVLDALERGSEFGTVRCQGTRRSAPRHRALARAPYDLNELACGRRTLHA